MEFDQDYKSEPLAQFLGRRRVVLLLALETAHCTRWASVILNAVWK